MLRFAYLMVLPAFMAGFVAPCWADESSKTTAADVQVPTKPVFSGRVERVLDGDTIILDGDRRVRLLDINTPEISHDGGKSEPYGVEAANALRRMVFGQFVTVQPGPQKKDRFGRLLGHVYLANGGWVNGTLVRDGYAHVYLFADNALYPQELLTYETAARNAKRGLWALPRWRVRDAMTCCVREDIGQYQLVEGHVIAATHIKKTKGGRTYLNFGPDWRTDFSIFIEDKDYKWFRKAGIRNIADHYRNKTVRVHGHLQPVNGVLVRVTHPAQIEIIGD